MKRLFLIFFLFSLITNIAYTQVTRIDCSSSENLSSSERERCESHGERSLTCCQARCVDSKRGGDIVLSNIVPGTGTGTGGPVIDE